jgi:hypothetical protein
MQISKSLLPLTSILDLVQLPASFIITDSGSLRIFVHIPVVSTLMTLYRYVSFPLLLTEGNKSITVEVNHLKGRDHLVATAQQELHVEVSEDELERMCFWVGKARVCDNLGAMSSQPADTCMGALFTGRMLAVSARCVTVLSTREWAVERTEAGWYLVYLRDLHLVRVVCMNGTVTGTPMKGYRAFQVDVGCSLVSPRFNVMPSRILDMRASVVLHLEWAIPDLLEGQSVAHITDVRDDLLARSVRPEEGVAALLDQAVAWSPEVEDLKTHVLSVASLVSVVIVIIILGVLCYRYRRLTPPVGTSS